mgnify:CR=1 FL=1
MRKTHDWTPCLSPHGLEFLYWLPKRSLYASLLRGFSHYRHVRRGLFYKSLGEAINLWVPYTNPTKDASVAFFTDQNIFSLDRVYYAGVAYFAIYCVAYYGLRFLGIFFHFVRIERLDQTRFKVIGGVLASLVSLVPLTMLGNILATVPINNIQTVLSSSWVLRLLINWNFPVSQIIQHLWTSVI